MTRTVDRVDASLRIVSAEEDNSGCRVLTVLTSPYGYALSPVLGWVTASCLWTHGRRVPRSEPVFAPSAARQSVLGHEEADDKETIPDSNEDRPVRHVRHPVPVPQPCPATFSPSLVLAPQRSGRASRRLIARRTEPRHCGGSSGRMLRVSGLLSTSSSQDSDGGIWIRVGLAPGRGNRGDRP